MNGALPPAAAEPAILPRELTIYTVGEVHPRLAGWARAGADGGAWRLQADAVGEVDGAGVQLLLSVAASARAAGATLRLNGPSEALVRACGALGAAAEFQFDAGEAAR